MSGESLMENESNEKRGFTPSPPSVNGVVVAHGTSSSTSGPLNHGIFLNQQPHHANGPGPGQLSGESSDRFLRAEMQRYDGWYNNLAHPDWGSLGTLTCVHHQVTFKSASFPSSFNSLSLTKSPQNLILF